MFEIGEQRDDVFLVLLHEAVEFAAERPAPLHRVDLETGVFVEDDTVVDRLSTDEIEHVESETNKHRLCSANCPVERGS